MSTESKIFELKNFAETGLLRVKQMRQLIPISRSSSWAGVKTGRYPQPFKLNKRTTVWLTKDIIGLIKNEYKGK